MHYMNITTDKTSQTTYISFSKGKVFKTRAFFNNKIIVDFGSRNRILGIEILGPIFSRPKKVEPASVVSVSEYIQNIQ